MVVKEIDERGMVLKKLVKFVIVMFVFSVGGISVYNATEVHGEDQNDVQDATAKSRKSGEVFELKEGESTLAPAAGSKNYATRRVN